MILAWLPEDSSRRVLVGLESHCLQLLIVFGLRSSLPVLVRLESLLLLEVLCHYFLLSKGLAQMTSGLGNQLQFL